MDGCFMVPILPPNGLMEFKHNIDGVYWWEAWSLQDKFQGRVLEVWNLFSKDNGYGSSWIILMAYGFIDGWPNGLTMAHFVIMVKLFINYGLYGLCVCNNDVMKM